METVRGSQAFGWSAPPKGLLVHLWIAALDFQARALDRRWLQNFQPIPMPKPDLRFVYAAPSQS